MVMDKIPWWILPACSLCHCLLPYHFFTGQGGWGGFRPGLLQTYNHMASFRFPQLYNLHAALLGGSLLYIERPAFRILDFKTETQFKSLIMPLGVFSSTRQVRTMPCSCWSGYSKTDVWKRLRCLRVSISLFFPQFWISSPWFLKRTFLCLSETGAYPPQTPIET